MSNKRPVVDSKGEDYESVVDAANAAWASIGTMCNALQATRRGVYFAVDGVQWAYAEHVPEVWPVKDAEQYQPLECPKRHRGFCPYRDIRCNTED